MTTQQYENLQTGDLVRFKNGHDGGRTAIVIFKKYRQILVESTDGKVFHAVGCNNRMRLTGFHMVDLIE